MNIASKEVSVIIPTHGRRNYLAEALGTVCSQTVKPTEVIVVDDIGDTQTKEVVNRYKRRFNNIRYLHNMEGSGASSSRNLGARNAKGQVLAFLDDDDLWLPAYLEVMIGALSREPGVSFIISWMDSWSSTGAFPGSRVDEGLRASDALANNPGMTGSNFVIDALVFEELNGFDDTLTVSNDKDLFVRLLLDGRIYRVVKTVNVLQRVHSGHRLSSWKEDRIPGMIAYKVKHKAILSRRDQRILNARIHSVRAASAPNVPTRLYHLLCRLVLSPSDVRWRRARHWRA